MFGWRKRARTCDSLLYFIRQAGRSQEVLAGLGVVCAQGFDLGAKSIIIAASSVNESRSLHRRKLDRQAEDFVYPDGAIVFCVLGHGGSTFFEAVVILRNVGGFAFSFVRSIIFLRRGRETAMPGGRRLVDYRRA